MTERWHPRINGWGLNAGTFAAVPDLHPFSTELEAVLFDITKFPHWYDAPVTVEVRLEDGDASIWRV